MSHHAESDSEFPPKDESVHDPHEIRDRLARLMGAGPTGQFPRGQLHRTDEGELAMAVTVEKNTVILAFGKPVSWIGFSRVEALELAELLKKRATEL